MTPTHPSNFYKGLPGFSRGSDNLTASEARESVYFSWWRFMRLSPVFWYARTTGTPINDPEIARTCELAGDLSLRNWHQWWLASGKYAFAEAQRPARLQQLQVDSLHEHAFMGEGEAIYVEVPLRIRQQTIIKQFKALLKGVHDGRSLNLARTSVAPLKLYTKRFNLTALDREFWILVYRLTNASISVARIGDRLQISPAINIRNQAIEVWKEKTRRPEHRLMSVTARYLMKARYTLMNAERGTFPDYRKSAVGYESMPFGSRAHADFIERTSTTESSPDGYIAWIRNEFEADLRDEVIRANRLFTKMRLPDSNTSRQFPAFFAGTSDKIEV